MNKILVVFFVSLFFLAKPVHAVCPVCTVAVGAGLGLSRYLGVDDLISGVWLGGLVLSSSFWTISFLKKKLGPKFNFKFLERAVFIFYYLLTLIPLFAGKIIGNPLNVFFGMDKLLLGTAIGSFVFLFGIYLDKKIRKIYKRPLFAFQKVVFSIVILLFTSFLLSLFV